MDRLDPDRVLFQAISFTENDLEANRDGYLTKAQRIRIAGEGRLWRTISIIGAAVYVFLVTYIHFGGLWDGTERNTWILLILFGFGIFILFAWLKWRQSRADLYKGEVTSFEYTMKPIVRRPGGRGFNYYIKVKGESVIISVDMYRFLKQEPPVYIVYITPYLGKLLSFERMDEDKSTL